jgi:hypothetical protein
MESVQAHLALVKSNVSRKTPKVSAAGADSNFQAQAATRLNAQH